MGFSVETKGYVHAYEAYRVPRGTTVKNVAGVDFSGLKTIGLGGVMGEFIDLSV